MAGRVTQEVAEVPVSPTSQSARVTQEVAEVPVRPTHESARVSQIVVEVLVQNPWCYCPSDHWVYRRPVDGLDDGDWSDTEELKLSPDGTIWFGDNTQAGRPNFGACIRWQDVNIPSGARIISATLTTNFEGQPSGAGGDIDSVRISGFDEDNTAAFTAGNKAEVLARSRTTAYVDWVIDGGWDNDTKSVDVTTVIQEIVNRSGYAGEALGVIVLNNGAVNSAIEVVAADDETVIGPGGAYAEFHGGGVLLTVNWQECNVPASSTDLMKWRDTPAYSLVINGTTAAKVVSLRLSTEWGRPAHTLTVVTEDVLTQYHINDTVDLQLGYEGNLYDIFTGYGDTAQSQRPEGSGKYTFEARGRLKKALETWLIPNTISDAAPYSYENAKAEVVVRHLLWVSGITDKLNLADPDFTFGASGAVEFMMEAAWDALDVVATILQYDIWQDREGFINFGRLDPFPADCPTLGVKLEEGVNLVSYEKEESDEDLRRRCVVFGDVPIKADYSQFSPWVPSHFGAGSYTAIISSEMIESTSAALSAATDFVERWNRLTRRVRFTAIGDPRIYAGETIHLVIPSEGIDAFAFVYSAEHNFGDRGYLTAGELRIKGEWSGVAATLFAGPAYSGVCTREDSVYYTLHDERANWYQPSSDAGSGWGEWERYAAGAKWTASELVGGDRAWEIHLRPGGPNEEWKSIEKNDSNDLYLRGHGEPGPTWDNRPQVGDAYEIWPAHHTWGAWPNPRVYAPDSGWGIDHWNDWTMTVIAGPGVGESWTVSDTEAATSGGSAPCIVLPSAPVTQLEDTSQYELSGTIEA